MEILLNSIELIKLLITLSFSYFIVVLLLKNNVEYIKSVRSLVTILIAYTLCKLTVLSKIDAKDFLLIASLVFNFYFIVKKRGINGENK